MSFWRTSFWSFVAVSLRAGAGLLVNKFFAWHFGAAGLTLLAHFQNLLNLFYLPAQEGLHKGLIRVWSGDGSRKSAYFWASWWWHGWWFVLAGVVLWLGSGWFRQTFGIPSGWLLVLWLSLVGQVLYFLASSFFLSQEQVRTYATLQALGAVLMLLFLYSLGDERELWQTLLLYQAGSSAGGVLALFVAGVRWQRLGWWRDGWVGNQGERAVLLRFIGVAFGVAFLEKGSQLVIRQLAMDIFSWQELGYWQAVVKVSDSYVFLFSATFLTIFYPKVAALLPNPMVCRRYVGQVMGRVFLLLLFCLGLLYVGREWVLRHLFSPAFVAAEGLFGYVLVGDVFRLGQYFLVQLLLAAGRLRLYAGLQLTFQLVYGMLVAVVFVFFPSVEALLLAMLCSYVLAAGAMLWFTRRWLFFSSKPPGDT